jgi:hypothetical protein
MLELVSYGSAVSGTAASSRSGSCTHRPPTHNCATVRCKLDQLDDSFLRSYDKRNIRTRTSRDRHGSCRASESTRLRGTPISTNIESMDVHE